MERRSIAFAFAVACAMTAVAHADAVEDGRAVARQATEAYDTGKYADAAILFRDALKHRPGHPQLMLNAAAASARAGQVDDAFAMLGQHFAMGLVVDLDDQDFAALANDPRFAALRGRNAENAKPTGNVTVAASLSGSHGLIEGVAFDAATGRIFASSVSERAIFVVEHDRTRPFAAERANGLFGAFGLAIDERKRTLWAASSALIAAERIAPTEKGRAGIFAFDLATGKPKQAALTPPDGKDHVIGDLAVAANGDVFASDGWTKKLYRLPTGGSTLEEFLSEGLHSPQGLALSADDTHIAIADYANGIHIVDRASRARTQLSTPANATLLGIDGILRHGRDLIAVQNGVEPQRLMRIRLNPSWTSIEGIDVLAANLPLMKEPALIAVAGKDLLIVGNAQWSRFTVNGARRDEAPLATTNIVRFALPPARP
jgi:sugar lactone lactonase YvrE